MVNPYSRPHLPLNFSQIDLTVTSVYNMSRPSHTPRRGAAHDSCYRHSEESGIKPPQSSAEYTSDPPCGKEQSDTGPDRRPHHDRANLSRTLYLGSAGKPRVVLNACGSQEGAYMDYQHHQASTWAIDPSFSPPDQSSSQHMFSVSQSSLSGTNNRAVNRPGKKQQAASRRLSAQDFELLIQAPSQSYDLLRQYVGADSRYSLAAVHAGIHVRLSVRSSDLVGRLKEAIVALARIRDFVRFVHSIPKDDFKSEQKGCIALRVCYSALTALLGDFSGDADVHAGDPQAPIVSRLELAGFRDAYPPVMQIVWELSTELGTSVNTYKHRRSPSPSVVLKLQAMLKTLEVWNDCLQDGTFTEPTRIIRTWLDNHPEQVNSTRRARGSSSQPSPVMSDRRPSPPGPYDGMFTGSMEMYSPGQPQLAPGSTTPGLLSPSMAYEAPLFVGSAPTFFPQGRAVGRSSHPGSHHDANYTFDFAGMGMYDHMNGSNYR
ncbi:hypothetical protein FRC08_018173 [Ceratobasidium sp. 394]|nr:hypothetical protein FRC08_018173 [Ceratobasidium sp. 394]